MDSTVILLAAHSRAVLQTEYISSCSAPSSPTSMRISEAYEKWALNWTSLPKIFMGLGGPHRMPPRAACGPRAAGWTALE